VLAATLVVVATKLSFGLHSGDTSPSIASMKTLPR
jgi:hypothetical protein